VTRTFPLAFAATLVALLACTSKGPGSDVVPIACMPGDATVPMGTALVTEDSAGTCPSAPLALKGTLLPGAACNADTDCAPSCCACGKKGTSALVASCAGKFCASVNELCCGYAATPTCM
jgi:hypothetical protein